jgi:hypothetical protein
MRFRHSAGFGKRIEFWIIGQMLREGLDVYIPLVDDNAIDAVVRRKDGKSVEVQIKARSKDVVEGDAALFAAIPHEVRSMPAVPKKAQVARRASIDSQAVQAVAPRS